MRCVAFIALPVCFKLFFPKICIRFRQDEIATSDMLVPEAAMHKDNSAIPGENKVRFSRKPFIVLSVAQAT